MRGRYGFRRYRRRYYYNRRWRSRRKWVSFRHRRWRPIKILNLDRITRAALAEHYCIYSFCTFPVFMQGFGRTYFGHKAYKYMVLSTRYISKVQRRHRNTYGSTIPVSLSNAIVQYDSDQFNENLIYFFVNNFYLSGIGDRLIPLLRADTTTETSEISEHYANVLAQLLNIFANDSPSDWDRPGIVKMIMDNLVVAPYYHNWPNIMGKLGSGRPGMFLPDSVFLKTKEDVVHNVYKPKVRKPYMYFTPFSDAVIDEQQVTGRDNQPVVLTDMRRGIPVRELNMIPKFVSGLKQVTLPSGFTKIMANKNPQLSAINSVRNTPLNTPTPTAAHTQADREVRGGFRIAGVARPQAAPANRNYLSSEDESQTQPTLGNPSNTELFAYERDEDNHYLLVRGMPNRLLIADADMYERYRHMPLEQLMYRALATELAMQVLTLDQIPQDLRRQVLVTQEQLTSFMPILE